MAKYKLTSLWTGTYAEVEINPDPAVTVFNIGDTVTVSGFVYNAASAAIREITLMIDNGGRGGISVNIAKGKKGNFSQSFEILQSDVDSNSVVGKNAKVDFWIAADYPSNSTRDSLYGPIFEILDETVAPVFPADAIEVLDANGHMDYFGGLVQGKSYGVVSLPQSSITVNPDGKLSGNVNRKTLEIYNASGEKVFSAYKSAAAQLDTAFIPGEIFLTPGTYTFTMTVRGQYGKSSSKSVQKQVLARYEPSLYAINNEPTVVRYKAVTQDDGETAYVPAADGTIVLFKFGGEIAKINGLNVWTLYLEYEEVGTDTSTAASPLVVTVGSESDEIFYDYADTLNFVQKTIPPDKRYKFTLTLVDYFGDAARLVGYASKAGAFFCVTPYGVAVGMRTTATAAKRKFEVAPKYESFFHGGISGVTNYTLEEVATGGTWINNKPIYRKIIEVGTVAAGKTVDVAMNTGALDAVVSMYGMSYNESTGMARPLPYANPSASTIIALAVMTYSTEPKVRVVSGSGISSTGVVVIVEYAKATSSATHASLIDSAGNAVIDANNLAYMVEIEGASDDTPEDTPDSTASSLDDGTLDTFILG